MSIVLPQSVIEASRDLTPVPPCAQALGIGSPFTKFSPSADPPLAGPIKAPPPRLGQAGALASALSDPSIPVSLTSQSPPTPSEAQSLQSLPTVDRSLTCQLLQFHVRPLRRSRKCVLDCVVFATSDFSIWGIDPVMLLCCYAVMLLCFYDVIHCLRLEAGWWATVGCEVRKGWGSLRQGSGCSILRWKPANPLPSSFQAGLPNQSLFVLTLLCLEWKPSRFF